MDTSYPNGYYSTTTYVFFCPVGHLLPQTDATTIVKEDVYKYCSHCRATIDQHNAMERELENKRKDMVRENMLEIDE